MRWPWRRDDEDSEALILVVINPEGEISLVLEGATPVPFEVYRVAA